MERRRRRKTRKSRRSRKNRKKKSRGRHKNKSATLSGLASSDPSTGTKDKVFGRDITSHKLEKTLCPPGLREKDREEFTDLLLDVTNLPGMYQMRERDHSEEAVGEVVDEIKGLSEALLTSSKAKKIASKFNAQWKSEHHTTLLNVSRESQLHKMIRKIGSCRIPVFTRQSQAIRTFLRRCYYHEDDIEDYLRNGLWIRIITDTFLWNRELLERVRTIRHEHNRWDGMASAMIEHHGRKLADIRFYAVDYKLFLLKTYVYFRELVKDDYKTPALQEVLWDYVSNGLWSNSPAEPNDDAQASKERGTNNSGCAHCRSKALHEALGVALGQKHCPLKGLERKKARGMVQDLLAHFEQHPNCNKAQHVANKVSEAGD